MYLLFSSYTFWHLLIVVLFFLFSETNVSLFSVFCQCLKQNYISIIKLKSPSCIVEIIYIIWVLSVPFRFKIPCKKKKKPSTDYTKIRYNWIKAIKTLKRENIVYFIKINIIHSDNMIVMKVYVPNNIISNNIK